MNNKKRIHPIWQNVKRSRLVWLTLILVISAAAIVTVAAKSSPEQIWKKLTASFATASIPATPAEQTAGKQHYFQLPPTEVARMVTGAPLEVPGINVLNSQSVLTLPDPNGKPQRFRLLESPLLTAAMAAKFPDIKSYAAQGIDDPSATARFSWTSRGLHGVILGNDYSIFVHPVDHTTTTNYVSYFAPQDTKFECGVKSSDPGVRGRAAINGINTKLGGTLRTYRLAIATPAEYTLDPTLGGGSVASTVASLNVWVNEMNAVYEREMSIRFTLVNNTSIIYTDAGTDPFTNPTDTSTTLTEVRDVLRTQVGIANYDLGHALLVGDTGGVAYLGVVCSGSGNASKGGGVSGVPAPLGYAFGASRIMHETGHQFGATHTFNDVASCADNREPTTAYEPGNGMTIMAYPVQCSTPIVPNRELRFHDGSLTQMVNFIAGSGGTCATTTSTGNNPPTVSGGSDRTIPRNTPFTLTATGSDPDVNDAAALTYVWEQIDAGGSLYGQTTDAATFSDAGDPSTTTRPIFRPFSPSSNPSRTFPSLTYILNNANVPPGISGGLYTAENLPNVTRTLNFRVTLRDNRAGGGAFSDDHVVLNVDGNSGPFLVTAPNTAVSVPAGSLQTITWSVNNTNQAPVNCTNVKISLSTDGGQTFPYVLAASTPNEGSANVLLPNLTSTTATARIKVEAVGNIFFDISDANFTISSGPSCPAVTSFAPGAGSTGTSVVITGTGFTSVTAVKFSNNVSASFTINNDSQITATQPAGAISGPITISKSGCSDVQTATYVACSTVTTAQVDDGSYDLVGAGRYIVNRLTPSSYPATLRSVSIRIASTQYLQAGTPFILLAGVNADGDTDINNTSFQTSNRVVTATSTFVRYDLAEPITIYAGDFVVGYTFPNGGATSSQDITTPQGRSYSSEDGLTFTLNSGGNFMVRADYLTSCDLGTAACPVVNDISPTSGQIGDTVTITGSGFAGVSGLTFNNNVIGNFTVVSDTKITAIVPPGATTGAITISEPNCSNVQTASFTVNAPVCMTVSGFSPPTALPGVPITIIGTNFTGASVVKFSGDAAAVFTVDSPTQITAFVPAGAIFGPITISKQGCADVQTTNFSPCNSSFTLQVDDGGIEASAGTTALRYYVNRLTPLSYPATLTAIQLRFSTSQNIPAGTALTLRTGVNPTGSTNINGISLTGQATTAGAPDQFNTYTLTTPVTINSGDFVIGFSITAPSSSGAEGLDTTNSQGRSYKSTDGGATFGTPTGGVGNYLIRGQYFRPCCSGVTITVSPSNGTLPGGQLNTFYSQTFTQSGGVGTATWSVSAGSLPAGLSLNASTGELSGTPTTPGTANFTIRATDQNTCTGERAYSLTIACAAITITPATLTAGTAGTSYNQSLSASGGITPYTFSQGSGSLPTGLSLSGSGVVSGVPTQTGTFTFTANVTDNQGCTGSASISLTINCQTITVTAPATNTGTAGSAFSQSFSQSGGIGTTNFSTASTLPTGITLSTAGVLAGTPTQTGSFPITVKATDSNGCMGTTNYTLTINCQTITVTAPATNTGTTGTNFSATFTQSGGIGTTNFTTASTLPTGITLSTAGVLSGTPTQLGAFPITVTATDSNGCTGSANYTLTISCGTITVTPPAITTGTAGAAFSQSFSQSGGTGSVTFSTASTLPNGVTFSSAGVLAGTPTQTGSFPITVTATDSNNCTGSANYTLTINCQTITVNAPATNTGTANAAFSATFTQSGGIGTTNFTTASTLPAGIALSTTGVLAGTPTQTGTFAITVKATDSNGCMGTVNYTLTINCQTITVTAPATNTGTVNTAFSETFTESGGIGTTMFSTASALPNGITLSAAGVLAGTPLQSGSFPIIVKATDSNGCMGTVNFTLVIACQTITVTAPATNTGTANAAFSATFTQSGGIGTTNFTTASTLPNGITLSTAGVLAGTPTQTGVFPITVTATDSNGCTGSVNYSLTISCQTITVNAPATNTGTANAAFSATFTQLGGIGTTNFTTTSTLPNGITLSTAGVLAGTPTQTGTFPITVVATDSNDCTGSVNYTLTINCQTITVTAPATNTGTANTAFSATFTQSGGIGTTDFTTASTLPTGITLSTAGVLAGTPTQTGTFAITVKATDSNGCMGTVNYSLTINCQTITVTAPANTSGIPGVPFSETFTQTGGIGATTFTTTSTLPTGLTLATNGTLAGTTTQTGSYPITVKATDSNGCMGTVNYTLMIGCPVITVNAPVTNTGTLGTSFSATFTQSGGNGTVTFSTASTLPNGLTLTSAGVLSGIPAQTGTFPISVTAADSNGCTGSVSYTLTINCQTITVTAPSTNTGTLNVAFSQTFTQSGGTGTTNFTTASALPTGITFSTAGVLSGTPTQSGSFPIVIKATDANGCMGTVSYTLTISRLQFYPLATPIRILDTRPGATNGCNLPGAAITGGTSFTQVARGTCSSQTIPANAMAITGNITTVESGGGFLTLYPSGAARPFVANSNFAANEILNNVFTVGLGQSDGAFKIYVTTTTNVVVDVTGYYAPPGAGGLYFHPLPKPIRLMDTRSTATNGCNLPGAPISAMTETTQGAHLTCDGVTIPTSARAIVGNATVVAPGSNGFLTLFPANATRPFVATSNYRSGQVMNGPFTAGLTTSGQFKIYSVAQTELVIDVLGYYSNEASDVNGTGLLFTPLPSPVRLLETRTGQAVGCTMLGMPISGGSSITQTARGTCDGMTVDSTALAIVGNATVVNPLANGFLTFWPSSAAQPFVAASNYVAGKNFNRHFIVGLGSSDGAFKVFSASTTDLVIDLSGYFAP